MFIELKTTGKRNRRQRPPGRIAADYEPPTVRVRSRRFYSLPPTPAWSIAVIGSTVIGYDGERVRIIHATATA